MTTNDSRSGRRWPWFVVLLLVGTAGAQGVLLYAATHDRAFAIEPDYYSKAVAWDSAMSRVRENATLAWTARAELVRSTAGDAALRITLLDALGAPVRGAAVRVVALHNLEAARPTSATFTESDAGVYLATLPRARSGLWELRIDAHAAGHRFTPILRAELAR
ncbi:MAG: FixH family protein [Gemmatimonadota bacterium]|nr:FixH family protein [Gemmatimonadota bacterium]